MDFVSIDFETANEKRNSACALGLVVVKENKIVEKKYWLIRPYEMRFKPINVWVHGITEEDVENELTMKELWEEVSPYFENNFIVAHNASFDISVIRKTLDAYEIPYPEFQYGCTMIMSKNYYMDAENYKLNTIARHLGIEFKHHHAGEDAEAAAKILIKICKELTINTIQDLRCKLNLKIGRVYNDKYNSCSSLGKSIYEKSLLDYDLIKINKEEKRAKKESELLNKTVVFTGPLEGFSRAEAMRRVVSVGGIVGSSVTRKTDYLVVAVCNVEKLSFDKKSNKLRKAELLIERGQDLKIISEDEFINMI